MKTYYQFIFDPPLVDGMTIPHNQGGKYLVPAGTAWTARDLALLPTIAGRMNISLDDVTFWKWENKFDAKAPEFPGKDFIPVPRNSGVGEICRSFRGRDFTVSLIDDNVELRFTTMATVRRRGNKFVGEIVDPVTGTVVQYPLGADANPTPVKSRGVVMTETDRQHIQEIIEALANQSVVIQVLQATGESLILLGVDPEEIDQGQVQSFWGPEPGLPLNDPRVTTRPLRPSMIEVLYQKFQASIT
jgi:hypothetical protein